MNLAPTPARSKSIIGVSGSDAILHAKAATFVTPPLLRREENYYPSHEHAVPVQTGDISARRFRPNLPAQVEFVSGFAGSNNAFGAHLFVAV